MEQSTLPDIRHRTPNGTLKIRSFCSVEKIRQYAYSRQFGIHAQYRSLYTKRESLEQIAEQLDANVTLAIADGKTIVGFGVLAYPEASERWAQLQQRALMEVKAIEVSRDWRSNGIAGRILEMITSQASIEDKIAYMVGYSWTWDLDGTRKTAQQYRQMLIRLFEPFGFMEYQTNEPNICLKAENLFMGRVGSRVSAELQQAFKWLRFGVEP